MHQSLRYQKAQQEMVDIQHFNQQEREDGQNCKTSLSYCRTSWVVSGKAIPSANCTQLERLKLQAVYLIYLLNNYHHEPPTQVLEDCIAFWMSREGRAQDMLSMIRELRQTLKLKAAKFGDQRWETNGFFRGNLL